MTTTFDPKLACASSGALPPAAMAARFESVADGGESVSGRLPEWISSAESRAAGLVGERPLLAVLAAIGAGALAGWLIKR